MPLLVHEKVFSAAEDGFISETYENLCYLQSLSENFTPKCVRTLDRGFDANDYYHYFLKRGERFVIRAKKNRNVIFNKKTYSMNLLATLATGYIGLTSSVHSEGIFLKELKECSRRIYEIPKFTFYALGYALKIK